MTRFLSLEGIDKTFGQFTALNDVNLDVSEGEFVTFLGPSGSGKTTTLMIIAGFEAASGGRVALRERIVTADEVGQPLGAIATGLGHRIYRGSQVFGFWEPQAARLEAGDVIIEVVPRINRAGG